MQDASSDSAPDEDLVALAVAGNAVSLERLLRRQQRWVFNLALYMLQSRSDAEDATQEILLKVATRLASFGHRSAFRTWARRIAINHVLDRRRSSAENAVSSFACFGHYLDAAPAQELASHGSVEQALLVEEARRACTLGMLLCFDRGQRLVFLLGEILETGDELGAELLELSRDNFRQRLARAREQLTAFLSEKCGLLDPRNPCRCARKTQTFIRDGIVDPARLQFVDQHVREAQTQAAVASPKLALLQQATPTLARDFYPLFDAPDVAARLRHLLTGPELRELLALEMPEARS